MTAHNNGHQVIATQVIPEVTFEWENCAVTAGPDIVDCYILLDGPCQGFHFQLSPN